MYTERQVQSGAEIMTGIELLFGNPAREIGTRFAQHSCELDDAQGRFQSKFHASPIERVPGVCRLGVRIIQEIFVKIRKIRRER